MARWVVNCKSCFKVLPQAEVAVTEGRFFPEKPQFPPAGLLLQCPDCNTPHIYQENELWYEDDAEWQN
jgi:hypothetical protein